MLNIFEGKFGIERETVRIGEMAEISINPHPTSFKENNPYITKDFAEAQIEMITPPCDSIDSAISMIEDIQQVVIENLEKGDMLWKHSNPPVINKDFGIPVATFESNPEKEAYREYLSQKYGIEKSIISGVHFNFSFTDSFIEELYLKNGKQNESREAFRNNIYLKITKYILKNRWYYIYLTSASPVFHNSFYDHCVDISDQLNTGDCIIDGLNSLRNSNCGYRNKEDIILNFNSWEDYQKSVQTVINNGEIEGPSELYTPVRLKEDNEGNIQYIELRFIDVNPFTESGISSIDLKYIHLNIIYALFSDDFDFDKELQINANHKHNLATLNDNSSLMVAEMLDIHDRVKAYFSSKKSIYNYEEIFKSVEERIHSEQETYAFRLKKEYEKSSYIDYHLEQSIREKYNSILNKFKFSSDQSLELSTKILIKEAIKEGIIFEILDSETNFISLQDPLSKKIEYVQQATKTNLDKYANVLAMENKIVTKQLLKKRHINVPEGYEIQDINELDYIDISQYLNRGVVIKPNTTNFGEGITIYPNGADRSQIEGAVEFALSLDSTVLIENFIKGKEYRFLVINEKVIGVLHRRAANVTGDGLSDIKRLVEEKNKNPLRGYNYVTPLEKIKLGEKEQEFLKLQGIDFNYIPKTGETVYLRENSNISTGGDSIDLTDDINQSYLKIAEEAVKALGVNISGVDIIIEDISVEASNSNYSILELNFNPAIHIHTYPLIGKNRKPAQVILESLF